MHAEGTALQSAPESPPASLLRHKVCQCYPLLHGYLDVLTLHYQPAVQALSAHSSDTLAATQGLKQAPRLPSANDSVEPEVLVLAPRLTHQPKPAGGSVRFQGVCARPACRLSRCAMRRSLQGQQSESVAHQATPAGGERAGEPQADSGCPHTKACGVRKHSFTLAQSPEHSRHASEALWWLWR